MQMQSSETKAGVHDLLRAVEDGGLDVLALLEMPVDVLDGDGCIVDQNADGQRQSAQRHDVERLRRPATSAISAHRTASGIEVAMMTVERQLPRNSRIIRLVSAAAMMPSRITPDDGGLHEQRLVVQRHDLEIRRQRVLRACGSASLTPCTMASVEAEPVLRMVVSTARTPSTCTMLCCGGEPSRTWPTSWM